MPERIKPLLAKPKTFLRTFWQSLTNPKYYRDILTAKFSFSVKYLFVLLFLISFLAGIKVAVSTYRLLPQIPGFIEESKKVLTETYPDNLKITVKDEKIKTNVKEPYYLDFPKKEIAASLPFKHLLTIDTQAKAEDFTKAEAVFLLTETSLVSAEREGTNAYKVTPLADLLKDIPDGTTLDKKVYLQIVEKTYPFLDKLPAVAKSTLIFGVASYPFIRAAVGLVGQMILLLPVSFLVFLVVKLLKKKIGFGKVYQFSLHAVTIPIILSFFLAFPGFYPFDLIIGWLGFFGFLFLVFRTKAF